MSDHWLAHSSPGMPLPCLLLVLPSRQVMNLLQITSLRSTVNQTQPSGNCSVGVQQKAQSQGVQWPTRCSHFLRFSCLVRQYFRRLGATDFTDLPLLSTAFKSYLMPCLVTQDTLRMDGAHSCPCSQAGSRSILFQTSNSLPWAASPMVSTTVCLCCCMLGLLASTRWITMSAYSASSRVLRKASTSAVGRSWMNPTVSMKTTLNPEARQSALDLSSRVWKRQSLETASSFLMRMLSKEDLPELVQPMMDTFGTSGSEQRRVFLFFWRCSISRLSCISLSLIILRSIQSCVSPSPARVPGIFRPLALTTSILSSRLIISSSRLAPSTLPALMQALPSRMSCVRICRSRQICSCFRVDSDLCRCANICRITVNLSNTCGEVPQCRSRLALILWA